MLVDHSLGRGLDLAALALDSQGEAYQLLVEGSVAGVNLVGLQQRLECQE